ncbi:AAA domain-containing protein, putative AbiEii toxin, Type IV TA system [Pseudomonas sp. NFPP33]|nr:AAA family ATPase [Pseudomonas sp. NFPP33]SDA80856.1 AAA domain-containing protein, putative AbiEii toxin, Type IV TA system [Pseudomonas sp. NFPP33]
MEFELSNGSSKDSTFISSVILEGVHNRYKLQVNLFQSLNILHGQNGTGKTTLLHAIANMANCDFLRFSYLSFSRIGIVYSNGNWVNITHSPEEYIVDCASGDSFRFTHAQAIETLRINEDDRIRLEHPPELIQKQRDFSEKNGLRIAKTSYFPAFRTMLEAWSAQIDDERHMPSRGRNHYVTRRVTSFSRNIFGKFLPVINFPSPLDIEESLRMEIREAQLKIGRYDSTVFTDSFVKVFSALLSPSKSDAEDAERVLQEISDLASGSPGDAVLDIEGPTQGAYHQLKSLINSGGQQQQLTSSAVGALIVYRNALRERKAFQEKIFLEINKYFEAVNAFLDKKELKYNIDPNRRLPRVGLKFPDNSWSSIKVMSSGERQLLTMLYAVTKMNEDSLVLIDEPEISLHIDWQEDLLEKMMSQLENRQIIVCTHSPSVAAGYGDYMIEITPDFELVSTAPEANSSDDDEELI